MCQCELGQMRKNRDGAKNRKKKQEGETQNAEKEKKKHKEDRR